MFFLSFIYRKLHFCRLLPIRPLKDNEGSINFEKVKMSSWLLLVFIGICRVKALQHSSLCCCRFNFASAR